jgi:hypothetical protein
MAGIGCSLLGLRRGRIVGANDSFVAAAQADIDFESFRILARIENIQSSVDLLARRQ